MGCAVSKVGPDKYDQPRENGGPLGNNGSAQRSRSMFPMLRQSNKSGRGGTPSLPPPCWPDYRKDEIFVVEDYADIDTYARDVPEEYFYGNFEKLAAYLTDHLSTDLERIRAVFTFLASIDLYSLQHRYTKLPDPHTPLDYLLKIHWDMGNHAYLFAVLCRAASLPCFLVTGITKSAAYKIGGPVDRDEMATQWNAVLVDQQWRLCDVFWASMCVVGRKSRDWAMMAMDGDIKMFEDEAGVVEGDEGEEGEEENQDGGGKTEHYVNEFFFLTDPDMLVMTHFPDKDLWQMLPEPIEIGDFEKNVYIRERFFQLGIMWNENSHQDCVVHAQKGEIEIIFDLPLDKFKNMQFRYILFKERLPEDTDEDVRNSSLERYVFYQKTTTGTMLYRAVFPVVGRFKMDIFGLDTTVHDNLDLVCSYIIVCDEAKHGVQPLPDIPDIGWGPGPEAAEKGLKPTTHEEGIIYSKDGNVEIAFEMENPLTVLQNLRHNELDELLLSRHAVVDIEDGEMKVDIRLPREGEYALNLFADDEKAEGDVPNVVNYLIRCENDGEPIKTQAYPKLHDGILGKGQYEERMEVRPVSHRGGRIKTDDGHISASFEVPENVDLYCEMHSNNAQAKRIAEDVKQVRDEEGNVSFEMDLKRQGEYGMNIYAKEKGEGKQMYHVHTYLVTNDGDDAEDADEYDRLSPIPESARDSDLSDDGKPRGGAAGRGKRGKKKGRGSGAQTGRKGTKKPSSSQKPGSKGAAGAAAAGAVAGAAGSAAGGKRSAKETDSDATATPRVGSRGGASDVGLSGSKIAVTVADSEEGSEVALARQMSDEMNDAAAARKLGLIESVEEESEADAAAALATAGAGKKSSEAGKTGAKKGDKDRVHGQDAGYKQGFDSTGTGKRPAGSLAAEYDRLTQPPPKTTPKDNFNEMEEFTKNMAADVEKLGKDMHVMTMSTTDEEIEIKLPHHERPILAELTRKNAQEPISGDQISWKTDSKQEIMNVRLPNFGEYKLDIYETTETGALIHVNTYNLWRARADEIPGGKLKYRHPKYLELQYRALRKQLRLAIASGNPEYLRIAIKEFEENKVPDPNNDIPKSKKLLRFWEIRDELKASMAMRQLHRLEDAVKAAERSGMAQFLGLQMAMANRIKEHLQGIEKIRHAILNLDQRTIAEIKSYSQPPEPVHHVMAAVYVLLGEPEENLKDWQAIKYLIGRTGKVSLKRLVAEFNVENLKIDTALQAYLILKKFTLDDVRDVSVGVATFYVWARKMIEECESRFTQAGGDIKTVGFKPLRLFSAKRNQNVPGMTHEQTVLLAKQRTLSAKMRTMKAKQMAMRSFNLRGGGQIPHHPAEKYRTPLERARAAAMQQRAQQGGGEEGDVPDIDYGPLDGDEDDDAASKPPPRPPPASRPGTQAKQARQRPPTRAPSSVKGDPRKRPPTESGKKPELPPAKEPPPRPPPPETEKDDKKNTLQLPEVSPRPLPTPKLAPIIKAPSESARLPLPPATSGPSPDPSSRQGQDNVSQLSSQHTTRLPPIEVKASLTRPLTGDEVSEDIEWGADRLDDVFSPVAESVPSNY